MKLTALTLIIILKWSFCFAQSAKPADRLADTIFINLNDNLLFEVQLDSTNNLFFKKIKSNVDDSKTISISLTYNASAGTFLKIQNPFSKALSYKAELYSYKKKDFIETSTIPVQPKLGSYETWPFKIDKIRLTRFALKEEE